MLIYVSLFFQPTTVMQAQPVAQTISTPATPTLPVNPVPQQLTPALLTPTIGTIPTINNAGQKQLAEVRVSLSTYKL